MEKITSGLPPISLLLYPPPNTQTLIPPIRPHRFYKSPIDPFYLIVSHIVTLSSYHLTLPLSFSRKGFDSRPPSGPQFRSFSPGAFSIPTCCIIRLPCGSFCQL